MSLRSRWHGFRNALRASSMMGRAFRLRDHGQLEEALGVCREAMRIAGPVDPDRLNTAAFGTIVTGALTIDDIASRLGCRDVAREPLMNALLALESANRMNPDRASEELQKTEREVRARLEALGAAG